MKDTKKVRFLLQWADNSLILGHRLGEWCGHGPVLEQDIAMTNIALDLIGEARNVYQYAAEMEGDGKDEDYYPYLRKERQFYNALLLEYKNTNFAFTIVRQFLFDTFHYYALLSMMDNSVDGRVKAIAAKSFKEASYHLEFSADWMKRLGDGTEESHSKMQEAMDHLWEYGHEFFMKSPTDEWAIEAGLIEDLDLIYKEASNIRKEVIKEATLEIPETPYFKSGGKNGIHTEQLGFILSEMQYMQRTYPGATW